MLKLIGIYDKETKKQEVYYLKLLMVGKGVCLYTVDEFGNEMDCLLHIQDGKFRRMTGVQNQYDFDVDGDGGIKFDDGDNA